MTTANLDGLCYLKNLNKTIKRCLAVKLKVKFPYQIPPFKPWKDFMGLWECLLHFLLMFDLNAMED